MRPGALLALLAMVAAGCSGAPDGTSGPPSSLARAVEAVVDRTLPFDFGVRADLVAEEAGTIRCASRLLATDPAGAERIGAVDRAYLVAVCTGITEQARAQHLHPVCLVAPVVADVGRRTTVPRNAYTLVDSRGERRRADVERLFPRSARATALAPEHVTPALWRRLGHDPRDCSA